MKTSADITKKADALQARLAAMRKEARRMKRLEDQRAIETQRRQEIQFAFDFVEAAKELRWHNSDRTYYDCICERLEEKRSEGGKFAARLET